MSSTESKPSRRLAQLDILRAVACILVIISHSPVPENQLMLAINRGGWIGVDLFFVLSGFLVTSLLFTEYRRYGRVRAGRFAIRRALKIYPAFYFFLLVTTLAIVLLANDLSNISSSKILAEALFVQNYFPSVWGHTWSLAVEEHFYIAVIALVWYSSRKASGNPFRHWPVLLLSTCITVLAIRVATADSIVSRPQMTHLRCDAMAMGILLAYLWNFHGEWFVGKSMQYRAPLLIGGLLMLAPPFIYDARDHRWIHVFGLTTNYIGSALVLFAVIPLRWDKIDPFSRSLAWIGTYSYSIYVWHAVVATWINPRLFDHADAISPHLPWVLSVCMSLALGIAMANLIEFPVLKLRDTLFPGIDPKVALVTTPRIESSSTAIQTDSQSTALALSDDQIQ